MNKNNMYKVKNCVKDIWSYLSNHLLHANLSSTCTVTLFFTIIATFISVMASKSFINIETVSEDEAFLWEVVRMLYFGWTFNYICFIVLALTEHESILRSIVNDNDRKQFPTSGFFDYTTSMLSIIVNMILVFLMLLMSYVELSSTMLQLIKVGALGSFLIDVILMSKQEKQLFRERKYDGIVHPFLI